VKLAAGTSEALTEQLKSFPEAISLKYLGGSLHTTESIKHDCKCGSHITGRRIL